MVRQGEKPQVLEREVGWYARIASQLFGVVFGCIFFGVHAQAQSASAQSTLSTRIESPVESQRVRKAAIAWKIGMDGESFANQQDQAQVAGFGVGAKLRYRLLPGLMARAEAGIGLQTGYAQSRFGDNTPKSGIRLKEAVVQYKPFSILALQAGAIDQGHLESPLLVANNSFPGVMEKLSFGNETLGAEIRAQQTVPTSTTMSTKTVDSEATPYFFTETLSLKARLFEIVQLKAFGSHYSFRSLPGTVAYESEAFGNTVLEVGPNSSKFAYDFDGWLAGGEAKLRILRGLWWSVSGMLIQNTKAPESYKNGQMTSTGFDIALPKDIDLEPKGFVFFNESDVAPAYYNSSALGHNNRQGWGASADLNFKKEKFKVGAAYVNADIINSSVNQSRQQFIRVQFETFYEML